MLSLPLQKKLVKYLVFVSYIFWNAVLFCLRKSLIIFILLHVSNNAMKFGLEEGMSG